MHANVNKCLFVLPWEGNGTSGLVFVHRGGPLPMLPLPCEGNGTSGLVFVHRGGPLPLALNL